MGEMHSRNQTPRTHPTPRTRGAWLAPGWLSRRALLHPSRIAQLDQRTALPDQCLHSAEADVRPPKEEVRVWTQTGIHGAWPVSGVCHAPRSSMEKLS